MGLNVGFKGLKRELDALLFHHLEDNVKGVDLFLGWARGKALYPDFLVSLKVL